MQFSPASCFSLCLRSIHQFSSAPCPKFPQYTVHSSLRVRDQVSHSYKTGKVIVLSILSLGLYVLDGRGIEVRFPAGVRDFSLVHNIQTGSGAHPTSYAMTTEGCFPGVKQQGRESDNSSPSSAEVKNCAAILPPPSPIRVHGAVFN
jgi:hypothetical protein